MQRVGGVAAIDIIMVALVGAGEGVGVACQRPFICLAGLLGSRGMLSLVDSQVDVIDGVAGIIVAVVLDNRRRIGIGVVFLSVAGPDGAVAGGDIVGEFNLVAYGEVQGVDAVALVVDMVSDGVVVHARGREAVAAPSHCAAVDDGLSRGETVVIDGQV